MEQDIMQPYLNKPFKAKGIFYKIKDAGLDDFGERYYMVKREFADEAWHYFANIRRVTKTGFTLYMPIVNKQHYQVVKFTALQFEEVQP